MSLKLLRLVSVLIIMLVAPATYAVNRTILIVGDSLSAGFGIEASRSWPMLLKRRLFELDYDYRVVNASISGDTTRGGRGRLPGLLLQYRPEIVIIELGGNDGMRALPIEEVRRNLSQMIHLSKQNKAKVLLVGMRLPPNYGLYYTEKFQETYRELAKNHRVAFVPFMLEGIGGKNDMMLPDLIHPRAEAQPIILKNIWEHLEPLLGEGPSAIPPPAPRPSPLPPRLSHPRGPSESR